MLTPIIISLFVITIINVAAYLWAFKKQSDYLTDISYSFCFIVLSLYFLFGYGALAGPRIILASMVIFWGVRLGGFLFYRIHIMGRDGRFDEFRGSKIGFLKFWLLQSLSIWIISLPIIVGLMIDLSKINWAAFVLWTIGWIIESIADFQKFNFRQQHSSNEFLDSGLYKYIRHPNYLGEIMIWISVFWYILPFLTGWMWLVVICPIWVILLLVKVSGIPLIEKSYPVKYGNNKDFKTYLETSWKLLPYVY